MSTVYIKPGVNIFVINNNNNKKIIKWPVHGSRRHFVENLSGACGLQAAWNSFRRVNKQINRQFRMKEKKKL